MVPYNENDLIPTERLLWLWDVYAEAYRVDPLRYQFLLAARRDLGIEPLNPIAKNVLNSYPEIAFFRIIDRGLAAEQVKSMPSRRVNRLIEQIETVISCDYAYHTIRSRIADFAYELNNFDKPKEMFGINPDARSNKVFSAKKGARRSIE